MQRIDRKNGTILLHKENYLFTTINSTASLYSNALSLLVIIINNNEQ